MNVPKDLLYSKDHEWVKKEADGKVRVGITEFAQKELGDIVFVELPESGEQLNAGDSFGSVESVKTVSELYAPVSGQVAETNDSLEDSPELVNESPYEKAWMVELESVERADFDQLLDAEAYEKLIGEDA
ncbi:glycine cleavage system protein GcvH [Sporolactobacillus putidus]|uniref:Glycine cleavage system H protein n=1 Tax=Sporolactobacillus putidus TaxID=492735 RepID=A0A917W0F7_9BACL|nr:glycine cleavage system protein GcvH [Sporolactobacillus putidus]GGL53310.1 glycine cleavage system H protein [Sporolactobacillus putidus]